MDEHVKDWDQRTWALGMMSGTSRDGIDAALVRTDGKNQVETGPFLGRPYDDVLRGKLAAVCQGEHSALAEVERELTLRHAALVEALLSAHAISPAEVGVIGFHGHTVAHAPAEGRTHQIGDGSLLAAETGIDVVADFRSRDMAAGGEGAPFAPLYHAARAADLAKPLAVVNIGGVANVTWIGPGIAAGASTDTADTGDTGDTGDTADAADRAAGTRLLAFDTGPGNALLDSWVMRHIGAPRDQDGRLAAGGEVQQQIVDRFLQAPYFERPPPKSLDRDDFDLTLLNGVSAADGAATLSAMTAAAVARAGSHLPAAPGRWLVCGGGRHNPVIMAMLAQRLGAPVEPVEAVGWNGDALEAEAFAYLAVRALKGLPLSLPSTTGVRAPTSGGRFFPAGDFG
jgi:anhydro-N-acetylmuramic acid kinase